MCLPTQVVNNELPPLTRAEDARYVGPMCEHCSCSIPEYLVSCTLCASQFCCRRIGYDESSDAVLDEAGIIQPTDTPGDADNYEMEEGCIIMHHYSLDGRRPPLEEAKQDFVCYDCWNYRQQGLYPVRSLSMV